MLTRRPSRSNLTTPSISAIERKIVPLADAAARMETIAHLADQDVAGDDALAAESLDAPSLRLRIAAVAAGALTFFMCHGERD